MKKINTFVSYTEQVYREIKNEIIRLNIKPGDSLQERSLAEQLGVSRTPVREALKKLEFEGWTETIPWKGVVVKGIEYQDLWEVFQCRYANEGFVGETIALEISEEDLQHLRAIHLKLESSIPHDREQFIQTDRDFHMYLAQLTNNQRMIQFLDNLSDQMLRHGLIAIGEESRMLEAVKEHQNILSALEERSAQKTREAVEVHIERTKTRVLQAMRDNN